MSTTLINNNSIPIIDMAYISNRDVWPIKSCTRQSAHKLYRALVDQGLALLVNHGITEMKLQQAYRKLDQFTSLSEDDKKIFQGDHDSADKTGYYPPGPKLPSLLIDYKHRYNVIANSTKQMPNCFTTNSMNQLECLFDDFKKLSSTLMQFIAIGIGISPKHFRTVHEKILKEDDESVFQLVYYPPTDDCILLDERPSAVKTENGMFVLVAQDSECGLQVLQCKKWVTVGYLPGAILLICGNLLKEWTEDLCTPVAYRFIVPADINIRSRSRHCTTLSCRIPRNTIEQCPAVMPKLNAVAGYEQLLTESVENLNDTNTAEHFTTFRRLLEYVWTLCRTPCIQLRNCF